MPGLVVRPGPAVLVEAELAGDHAAQRAALAPDQRARGHAGKDLDAERLGLLRQPAADVAHRDDVVAVVRSSAAASASSGCGPARRARACRSGPR